MAKRFENGDLTDSVIGPSVKVDGDLSSEGNLQVEGTVNGKVSTSRDLFIGETAKIQANVSAQNATVAGIVDGDIKAADTVVLLETGKVMGNIYCQRLGVREGAFFSGQVTMDTKNIKADVSKEE